MALDLAELQTGSEYSRHLLSSLWGYKSFHALARGVVTPANDNKIILFITKDKQESAEQYRNVLNGNKLSWEGPTDHFAEQRMVSANTNGDEIHVFYRDRHHADFMYLGKAVVENATLNTGRPSSFEFQLHSA